MEVSGYLVGSPAFKAGGTSDPRSAGSIPVHLRQIMRSQQIRRKGKSHPQAGRPIRWLRFLTGTWQATRAMG